MNPAGVKNRINVEYEMKTDKGKALPRMEAYFYAHGRKKESSAPLLTPGADGYEVKAVSRPTSSMMDRR